MKRKIDWDDEEESGQEDSTSSDEENASEEPRINDVLNTLSQAVSRKYASDLLHRMSASKDILFWTPRGELLRNQRRIPVTNISELVEYVLLPHNTDVARPRALNTFLDGLAQLGVDKRLIKNKKVLSDILQKDQAYRDREESDNETSDGNSTDSSDEETASEPNNQQQESENVSDPEFESDDQVENSDDQVEHCASEILTKESAPCHHCESSIVSPSVAVKCPICLWHDNQRICPICSYKIPVDRKHMKDMFTRCYDCGSVKHIKMRNSKETFHSPSDNEGESY